MEDRNTSLAIEEILTPAAFPHAVTRPELHETHISWVVLTGDFAYKIKKSVRLDFLDTTELARRQFLCEEEVRLNRRTAPDIYLGVVAITRDKDGLRISGRGPIIEYAVKMRQFDRSQEMLALITRGAISLDEVVALGERIARFHSEAAVAHASSDLASGERQCEIVRDNLSFFLAHEQAFNDLPELRGLIDWTQDRLQSFKDEARWREQSGMIRECHGDLHARNIVRWQDSLTPFDCLEFDPGLRWIDVMNDVAFLAMDLVDHGRNDLEAAFLSRYLEITGDYAGLALLSFYAVYRALVRAKVDVISAEQQPAKRIQYRNRLRSRIQTALAFANPAPPTLFLMHGPSGSGKSWLSERLVLALPAIRIRSDLERKRVAGFDLLSHRNEEFAQGIYSPEFTHRTYARLLDCAESCLRGGINTIVDAAFLDVAEREMFQTLAARSNRRLVIVSCNAEPSVLADRIANRKRSGADPSDADIAVLSRQLENMEPLQAAERPYAIAVDTSSADAVALALNAINTLRH